MQKLSKNALQYHNIAPHRQLHRYIVVEIKSSGPVQ
jgi:hypothetical protein